MPTRRREDPRVRRAQILEAAERCFRTLGFQASTVDRIAAEAQVSVGLLYRFFESKSAIIEAIILGDVQRQLEHADRAIERATGGPTRILRGMMRQLAHATVDPDRIALMFEIAAEVCRNPSLRSFVRGRRAEAKGILVETLMRKGVTRRAAERMIEHLEIVSATASGAAMHAVLYADGSPERSLRLIAELIDGIVSGKRARRTAH